MGRIGPDLSAAMADTNRPPENQLGETLDSPTGSSIRFNHQYRSGSVSEIPDSAAAEQSNLIQQYDREYARLEKEIEGITDENGEPLRGQEQALKKLELRAKNLAQGVAFDQYMARRRLEQGAEQREHKNGQLAEQAAEVDKRNAESRRKHGTDALTIGGRR